MQYCYAGSEFDLTNTVQPKDLTRSGEVIYVSLDTSINVFVDAEILHAYC